MYGGFIQAFLKVVLSRKKGRRLSGAFRSQSKPWRACFVPYWSSSVSASARPTLVESLTLVFDAGSFFKDKNDYDRMKYGYL
jgi:hypothetical protein